MISRKELLKKVTIDCNEKRIPETDIDNFPVILTVREIKDLIRKEPLAYNVDKVIERLEECKSIMLSPTTMDCFGTNCEHNDCLACVFEKAIEIVKNG